MGSLREAMILQQLMEGVQRHIVQVLTELGQLRQDGKKDSDKIKALMSEQKHKRSDEVKAVDMQMQLLLERSERTVKLLEGLQEPGFAGSPRGSPRSPRGSVVEKSRSSAGKRLRSACAGPKGGQGGKDEQRKSPKGVARTNTHVDINAFELMDTLSDASDVVTRSTSTWKKRSGADPESSDSPSRKGKKKKGRSRGEDDLDDDSPGERKPKGSGSLKKKKKTKDGREEQTRRNLIEEPWQAIIEDTSRDVAEEKVAQRINDTELPEHLKAWMLDRDQQFYQYVNGKQFFIFINFLIVSNVLFIAMQSEHRVRRAADGLGEGTLYAAADLLFSAFFALEVGLRFYGDRAFFFLGPDAAWNLMDVLFFMLDLVNVAIALTTDGGLVVFDGIRGAVRGLRLVRAARVLRVLKTMRVIKMVRLLVDVIQVSLGFTLCFITMLTCIFVFFSVIFMQATADALLSSSTSPEIRDYFGTVQGSMLTLFWCITGQNTQAVYDTLSEASLIYGVMLLVFIFFMSYAIGNSVTAALVEFALNASRKYDLEGSVHDYREIERLLKEADTSNDGMLTWKEIATHLNRADVREKFTRLGLDRSEAQGLVQLVTPKEDPRVDIVELTQVCARFTRMVRSADFVQVLLLNKKMLEDVAEVKELVQLYRSPSRSPRSPMSPSELSERDSDAAEE